MKYNGPVKAALATLIAVSAFATGIWFSAHHRTGSDGLTVEGLLWPDPPGVASFHLIDHRGTPFTHEELKGRWSLVFFGFTHCPDVCPTSLQALSDAYADLKISVPDGKPLQVVFVSVDPERDTIETLSPYVGYFSPEFIAATSSVDEVRALARSIGVLFMKIDQGDGYTMDHSAGIFYISPAGRLISVLTAPHNAVEIVERFQNVSTFIHNNS